ncbi:MAG: Crp/Fnr family transcriptional regulator [bacterium]
MKLEQEIFDKYGRVYKDGEVICKEGDPGDKMFIIHEGQVKITKRVANKETTLAVLKEGEFFGEMAIIDNEPRSASAIAQGETKLIELDSDIFEEQIRNNPKIIMQILKKMSQRLREANHQIQTLLMKSNSSKVAGALLLISNRFGKTREDGTVELNGDTCVKELTNMVNLAWDRIQEVLKLMGKAKVIWKEGEKLIVKDLDSLQKFMTYLEIKEELGI